MAALVLGNGGSMGMFKVLLYARCRPSPFTMEYFARELLLPFVPAKGHVLILGSEAWLRTKWFRQYVAYRVGVVHYLLGDEQFILIPRSSFDFSEDKPESFTWKDILVNELQFIMTDRERGEELWRLAGLPPT